MTAADQTVAQLQLPGRFPGPRTRSRRTRTLIVYGVVVVSGFTLAFASERAGLMVFGLGLAFPGAGFLAMAGGSIGTVVMHVLLATLTVGLFCVSIVVWWWCGNVFIAPLVWFASAVGAATMSSEHHVHAVTPAAAVVALTLVAFALGAFAAKQRTARSVRRRRTQNLAALRNPPLFVSDPLASRDPAGVMELTPEGLAALRFALDRGLQPVDEFEGFHFGDQWQLSATRYQVFTLGWALALANHNALPAMRGYLQQAQLNLIDKTRDRRLWAYWKWENAWGNLRLGADPLARDNVMYSGYMGKQIGLYQAATGDLRHDSPGAVTLMDKSGRRYVYDFPTIVDRLTAQFEGSDLGLWPCEPNWIYVFCNCTAGIAIRAYDALHNTDHWGGIVEKFERLLTDEFTDPAGDITELKSVYTGMSPSITNGPGTNLNAAVGLHPLSPARSQSLYRISRPRLVTRTTAGLQIASVAPDFDPGNMSRSPGYALGVKLHAAREFGDHEFANVITAAIEQRLTSDTHQGVLTYQDVSVWGHALLLMGRVGTSGGLRALATLGVPEHIRRGPVLADVKYPDVLVARATNDGTALDAVLYPGVRAGRHNIGFGQLRPNYGYRALLPGQPDTHVHADHLGMAHLDIDITGRTPIRIEPKER